MSHSYDAEFFERLLANRSSTEAVVLMIVGNGRAALGCGCRMRNRRVARGLSEGGIGDVLVFDGDYEPGDRLLIPLYRLVVANLSAPLALDRRFDRAIPLGAASRRGVCSP